MSNRQWLKELMVSETVAPLGLDGTYRLETAHTIYVFHDGVCVDIARRDFEDDSNAEVSLVGTRVVGWLLDVEGTRRLVNRWLPGARAVLWRPSKIALTSPAFGFVQCSQVDEEEEDLDTTAAYTPPPVAAVSTGSFTRLFPQ